MMAPHLNMILVDNGVPAALRHPLIKNLKVGEQAGKATELHGLNFSTIIGNLALKVNPASPLCKLLDDLVEDAGKILL